MTTEIELNTVKQLKKNLSDVNLRLTHNRDELVRFSFLSNDARSNIASTISYYEDEIIELEKKRIELMRFIDLLSSKAFRQLLVPETYFL